MSAVPNPQKSNNPQESSNASLNIGAQPLKQGERAIQAFTTHEPFFSGIGLQIATFGGQSKAHIHLQLAELSRGTSKLLANETVSAADHFDEDFYELIIDADEDSSGKSYQLSIAWTPSSENDLCGFVLAPKQANTTPFNLHYGSSHSKTLSISMVCRYAPTTSPHLVPPGLMISPVTSCDLNCTYCISRETRKKLSVMKPSTWEQIKEYALKGHFHNVMNDYSGDIFFAEDRYGGLIDRMLDLDLPYSINTHANRLKDEYIEKLFSGKFQGVNFSVDASTQETFSKIRRGSSPFEEVIKNIRNFMNIRSQLGREDTLVSFSMILMKCNMPEFTEMMDIARSMGINRLFGNHLHVYTEDLENESWFDQPERFNELWKEIMHKATKEGFEVALPRRFETKPQRSGHTHCPLPWTSAIMLGNGDVMACCVPSTVMGNVHTRTLDEIWNGVEYKELRRRINTSNPPEVCKHCPVYKIPSNPTSFYFNRIRNGLKPLGLEMLQSANQQNNQ